MNFKQCCGTLTDLIVSYLQHLASKNWFLDNDLCAVTELDVAICAGQNDIRKGTLILKQSMILFVELIENSREGITRLGCACLK